MKTKIMVSLLLVLFIFPVLNFAAGSPSLQVTSYSTVPSAVYMGTTNQLKLNIANSGTDTATGITISYGYNNDYIQIGDISAGGNAIATMPFSIPLAVEGGIYIIPIKIYYSDSTGSSNKNSPISIPVQISQYQILEVKTISLSKTNVQAGEGITAQIQIINSGGKMSNLFLATPSNSDFNLAGTNQQLIGEIASNTSKTISVKLVSSSSTASGKYTIPLVVSYQDILQNNINQTVYIGPITVTDASNQFRIELEPKKPTEIGSEIEFDLTVENTGESGSSVVVDLNQSAIFTPIGSSRVYFDFVGPDKNETKTIKLGIGATSLAGYYNLPLVVTANGKTFVQNIGIPVQATSDVTVTSDVQPQYVTAGANGVKVTAQIANIGNTPIRSVYVSTSPTSEFMITGATDKFIGTLNVDDFTTFQFSFNAKNQVQPGTYNIPIRISFKDSENQPLTVIKNIQVTVYGSDMARFNNLDNSGSTNINGRRNNGGGIFGLGLIPTIIIAIVIIVAGFFGYKKWKVKNN